MINEVLMKYAELLIQEQQPEDKPQEIELLPNRFAELDVGTPYFMANELYSVAADEDISILKEKKRAHEPEDMIEKAHPKSVYVADALGNEGLVENQNEQQTKIIQMINKLPTGNHIHIYAYVIEELVKVADDLEDKGHLKAAAVVEEVLADLTNGSKKKLISQAVAPLLAWGIVALLGVTGGAGSLFASIRGTQDGLVQDSQELLNAVSELSTEYPNSSQMALSLARDVQQLVTATTQLRDITNRQSATATEINNFQVSLQSMRTLLTVIDQKQKAIAQREHAYMVGHFPGISGTIADLNEETDRMVEWLNVLGTQAMQQHRAKQQTVPLPGQQEVERIREEQTKEHAPKLPSAPEKTLSAEDQQKVIGFLNTNYQDGVHAGNLKDKLEELSRDMANAIQRKTGITVGNLSGQRLSGADVSKLRRLFDLVKDPEAVILQDYQPEMQQFTPEMTSKI